MPQMRGSFPDPAKFYTGGISLYPEEELYREMSFISYYYHWSRAEVFGMGHGERRAWCSEISDINRSRNPSGKKEKNIFDLGRV